MTGHSTTAMLDHYTDHETAENMEAVRIVQREAFSSVPGNQ